MNDDAHIPDLPASDTRNTDELPYIRVQLQQGTAEWATWRHGGIGASDAPAVLGECRFRTPERLLEEKRGPAGLRHQTPVMARGEQLEPEARAAYIAATGIHVEPACLQSRALPWLRASVDGIGCDGRHVVEIKCGKATYRDASRHLCVPPYYAAQMQHILAVTGLAQIDVWFYQPDRLGIRLVVQRDAATIERLIATAATFREQVLRPAHA